MALHEQSVGATDEGYTPSYIFDGLECSFDMDVASPGVETTPWIPALKFLVRDGLVVPWEGFVWMNAPFGGRNGLVPWLSRFITHGNGICLVPDRTSAPWWQKWASRQDAILFVSPKIRFVNSRGETGNSPAQGTCLGAMGSRGVEGLCRAAVRDLGILLGQFAV